MCIRDSREDVVAVEELVLLAVDLDLRAAVLAGEDPVTDLCLLYTSDAADERSSVDLGGRRIIKKKKWYNTTRMPMLYHTHKLNIYT